LDAEGFVRRATPKRSKLHPYLQWDNETAAHEYRLDQARGLMRSIEVIVELPGQEAQRVRGFHAVYEPERECTVYAAVQDVVEKEEYRDQIVAKAQRHLDTWLRQFSLYGELAEAAEKVRAALQLLEK